MIKCPSCAYENPDGTVVCTSCGHLFDRQATLNTHDSGVHRPARDKDNIRRDAHVGKLPADGLAIYVGQSSDPIIIVAQDRLTLGRRKDAAPPDLVDLAPYDAYRLGVSRNHAVLTYKEKHLYIHDIGSVNGTWLNSQRLRPYELYALPAGAIVNLGQLPMFVFYVGVTTSSK